MVTAVCTRLDQSKIDTTPKNEVINNRKEANVTKRTKLSLVDLEFRVNEKKISLFREGFAFTFENLTNLYKSNEADVQGSNIIAPITGSIAKIMVKNGQMVSKEEPVMFIEAMKMEYQLVALKSGKVSGVKNKKGDLIEKGEILLEIE